MEKKLCQARVAWPEIPPLDSVSAASTTNGAAATAASETRPARLRSRGVGGRRSR